MDRNLRPPASGLMAALIRGLGQSSQSPKQGEGAIADVENLAPKLGELRYHLRSGSLFLRTSGQYIELPIKK